MQSAAVICLPPELTDRIIDHLHNSFPDLRACALVCRNWATSCRLHLFYHVHINIFRSSQCRRLYDVVCQSPSIAFHIRELKLSAKSRASTRRSYQYISTDPQFARILSLLLQSFVELRKVELHYINWNLFTPDMKKSFSDILDLPSLVHFETDVAYFSSLEQFTETIRPHLKRLKVGTDWRTNMPITQAVGKQDIVERRQSSRIEELMLHLDENYATFIEWLLGPQCIIDLSSLRTLEAKYYSQTEDITMKLITRLGASLEHLSILPVSNDWCAHLPLNSIALTHLHDS
jgi:hypothetical protein